MSTLRDARGLRRVSGAEPQVVGLAPQTTKNDRRANTMKTYILRDPKAVEPQNRKPKPLPPLGHDPGVTATEAASCGPPASAPPALAGRVLFIGLDVLNGSIAVSLAPSDSTEVRRYGIIGGHHDDVLNLLKRCAPCGQRLTHFFYFNSAQLLTTLIGALTFASSGSRGMHWGICMSFRP